MIKKIGCLIFIFVIVYNSVAQSVTARIHIDQFGYTPQSEKVAVISDPQEGYNGNEDFTPGAVLQVRDESQTVIFEGEPMLWNEGNTHSQSGDKGWWFDFSSVTKHGLYHIYDPENNVQSYTFSIAEDIYSYIMKAAGRMFYYNRCNAAKTLPYANEKWTDEMSFMNEGQDSQCRYVWDRNNPGTEKDLSGGWFDAGDYNKYVTFAYNVVHDLLSAYEENPDSFGDNWNIPESGNGVPDIIDEIVYELDWLQKMQTDDGSVIIKMGSIDHGDNAASPPSINKDPRYYGPTCTSATIAVAGIFAHASIVLKNFSAFSSYSNRLRSKAELAWTNISDNLESGNLEIACDDGTIKAGDADWSAEDQRANALTAAAYLFMLTGEEQYHQYFSENIMDAPNISGTWWGPYTNTLNEALLKYSQLDNGIADIQSLIRERPVNHVNQDWDGFYGFNSDDLYRAYVPTWAYHWGSNNVKAQFATLNHMMVRYNIANNPTSLLRKAAEQLHYFHGVNPLGKVQLSNMYAYGAEDSANEIYHTWFNDNTPYDNALTSSLGPAPGYVVGGANKDFSINDISPPYNQPPQKSYLDWNTGWPENSWEITEPAIYYQSAYIRLLANFVSDQSTTSIENDVVIQDINIYPNPSRDNLNIEGLPDGSVWRLMSIQGRLILQDTSSIINVSMVPTGMYIIRVSAGNKRITRKVFINR